MCTFHSPVTFCPLLVPITYAIIEQFTGTTFTGTIQKLAMVRKTHHLMFMLILCFEENTHLF